jgi:hypothetical protein
MKPQEINKIKQLDAQGMSGTIQSTLMDPNINQAHYAEVLYYLLCKTLEEKSYLERASNAMTRVLQGNGLLDDLNKCLELEEKL